MMATVKPPDVTVVVVSWNTLELTLECLRSVFDHGADDGLTCDAVLVDNASGDRTVEAVEEAFPSVRIVALDSNVGFARAANRGIVASAGRFVLFLNSDAQLPPGAVARLVAHLDASPRAGAVGAALQGADGSSQFACGRFLTPWNQFAESAGLSRLVPFGGFRRSYDLTELDAEFVDVDWCVGACLLVRRDALDEVGRFDVRFFMYSEDEDLCLRLRKAGWTVVHSPAVVVSHRGGASASRALDRMRKEARESQNAFARKHFGLLGSFAFRLLMSIARLKPRRDASLVGWGR